MCGEGGSQRRSLPADIIADTYLSQPAELRRFRAAFAQTGYLKLPGFLVPEAFRRVSSEIERLHSVRVRRDFVMPDFNTDRRMSVLSGKEVVRRSEIIADLYANRELRAWISSIVGEDIHAVNHEDEFLVVNFLDGKSDTHGWHLDDPRYAFIVVVDSPAQHQGGCLEYVPGWKTMAREEGFQPCLDVEAAVEICRIRGRFYADAFKPGDCYLLDAAEVLHRVSPLSHDASRKALNLAFDDRRYRVYGHTAKKLYG